MAITLEASELQSLLGVDRDTAERLFNVASPMVTEYMRGSTPPGGIENEMVIRICGHLHGMPKPAIKRESAGPLSVSYAADNVSALIHSGAAAIGSPYKVRRATVAP